MPIARAAKAMQVTAINRPRPVSDFINLSI
jgi:hypothetical protein